MIYGRRNVRWDVHAIATIVICLTKKQFWCLILHHLINHFSFNPMVSIHNSKARKKVSNSSNCFEGGVSENFEFQLGDDTDAFRSCSAILNGELYVFGGNNKKKQVFNLQRFRLQSLLQVSKVIDCGLKRIGDLNYDFYWGTCATYSFPQERIMLCFSNSFTNKCER